MIAGVIPVLLIAVGVGAIMLGAAALWSLGPRFRVGRLLASTPKLTVGEANVIARDGARRYVRIDGRIDAADEFEDADHRPLVFRRTRLEASASGRWTPFEDSRESVPFEVREGLDGIAIDADALGDGLVVVPRQSSGTAGDLGDRAPASLGAGTPVRAIIEQVSSVEHAIVLGVPIADSPDAPARLTAGLGRPLVLTTLEPGEAMRILAGGTARPRLAAFLLGGGAVLVILGAGWAVAGSLLPAAIRLVVPLAMAASPTPGAAGGDPRSSGEGPGLVGEPLLALVGVLGIAVAAIVATTLYIRLTGGPGGRRS
jgi:hypothetical protein